MSAELGTCWCGAKLTGDSFAEIDTPCGGSGVLICFCGGDQCTCHNHGETECPGCEDCDFEGDDYRSFEQDPEGYEP